MVMSSIGMQTRGESKRPDVRTELFVSEFKQQWNAPVSCQVQQRPCVSTK